MASSRMVEIQNSAKSCIPTQSFFSTESKIETEDATHLRDRSTVTEEKFVTKGKNKFLKKVENSPSKDPLQSVWCSLDKCKSKSGRTPKKQMIQKSHIHPGKVVNSGFPDFTGKISGELVKDREEILFCTDFACRASPDEACKNSFWKEKDCYFTSVTSQEESYLKHQLDFSDVLSESLCQIPGDENDNLAPVEVPSLYQRLISAIIEDDESREMSLHGAGLVAQSSQCDTGSVENTLRVELQRLDLCPKMHAEGEDGITKDINKLEAELIQQALKKKKFIGEIYESIQRGKPAEKRKLEQAAMSKLVEMAYTKKRVSLTSLKEKKPGKVSKRVDSKKAEEDDSPKTVLREVSQRVALPFAERTLAICREFEDTGRSCFEGALENFIFSSPMSSSVPSSVGKHTSGSSNGRRPKCSSEPHNVGKNLVNPPTEKLTKSVSSQCGDYTSILDLEVDDMQDMDWQGLDIPMDNLSDISFYL